MRNVKGFKLMKNLAILLSIMLLFSFCSCSDSKVEEEKIKETPPEGCELMIRASEEASPNPLEYLTNEENTDLLENSYSVIYAEPEDHMMDIVNGDYDVAILPTDMAYYLYYRSEQSSKMLAVTKAADISVFACESSLKDITEIDKKTVYINENDEFLYTLICCFFDISDINADILRYTNLDELDDQKNCCIISDNSDAQAITDDTEFYECLNITEHIKEAFGELKFIPLEVMMVNNKFANANPGAVYFIRKEYENAVNNVYSDIGITTSFDNDSTTSNGNKDTDSEIVMSSVVYIDGQTMEDDLLLLINRLADKGYYLYKDNIPDDQIFLN